MSQTVTIPEYIMKVKLSNTRRPTYYEKSSRIPNKYKTEQFIFKEKKYTHGKKMLLYNTENKTFVYKNEKIVNKPRFLTIGGNMLYAGMNEHLRMKMVIAIKDDFRRYIQSLERITKFPIHITAELHAKPEFCNWDVDNLWIYIKVFQDLLTEYDIIPDDSVRYITKSTSFEFFPVKEYKNRKMVFHINPDTRSVINHVMFKSSPVPILYVKGQYASPTPAIYITVRDMKSGSSSLIRDGIHFNCQIGIGKRALLYGDFKSVLHNIRYWAVQYDVTVVIDHHLGSEFKNYDEDRVKNSIMTHLSNEGITVIIHNS